MSPTQIRVPHPLQSHRKGWGIAPRATVLSKTTRYCGVVVEGVVGVVVGVVGEVLPPIPWLAFPEADPNPVALVEAAPPPNKLALAFICSIRGS